MSSARTEDAEGFPPLAEAKLATPSNRSDATVARPRIAEILDRATEAKLVLVAAPAGYGKTTAVNHWCAARSAAVVWVTLDAGDNDATRLWMYVATAVDRVRQGLGRAALRRLASDGCEVRPAIDELANGVRAFADELVIVFDDAEAVSDRECLATLDYVVGRLPANARLILLSRVAPALRLAQLRARGELAELRSSDLAFTTTEALQLLNGREGLGLDRADVATLVERTEGWPAALVLAAIWLRSVDDRHQAVRTFGGQQRLVADYLGQEVLGAIGADVRDFTVKICMLGWFTPSMCDDVLERSGSAALLLELEHTNLFLTRLEHGDWFRIHPLFAGYAESQLEATSPGAAAGIHRRAAAWLRSRGMADRAVEQALMAGDHALLADVLDENHLAWIRQGRSKTLMRWTETLPEHQLLERPRLAVAAAVAATLVGQGAIARRRFLRLADQARACHPEPADVYVQALTSMIRSGAVDGDVGRALSEGRRAVELAERAVDEVRVAALAGYAQALYFAGDLDDSWEAASRAIEHPSAERRPLGHAFARSTLALIAVERGRLTLARTHVQRAKASLRSVGSNRSWLGAKAATASACLLAAEGDAAAAERDLSLAEHLFRDEVACVHHTWVLLLLARVRCRRGRLHGAHASLASARGELAELIDAGRVEALADDVAREIAAEAARASGGELVDRPSTAELAVLRMLETELSAREIADRLHLSPNTVRSHIRALYRKLGVSNRSDAVARADSFGLLDQT